MKLKLQYLELRQKDMELEAARHTLRSARHTLWLQLLAVVIGVITSLVFMAGNDTFNVHQQNKELSAQLRACEGKLEASRTQK